MTDKQEIRLPTEAEWEKAARGDDGRIFPWGAEITPEFANYGDTGLGVTSTVGCFSRGQSLYGCEDMSGNVWEWCRDWFDAKYYSKSPKENPRGPESGSPRVIRGGAWRNGAGDCRSASRNNWHPGGRDGHGRLPPSEDAFVALCTFTLLPFASEASGFFLLASEASRLFSSAGAAQQPARCAWHIAQRDVKFEGF